MESTAKVLKFDPIERIAEKVAEESWETDKETVEMDMSDLSDIADGFNLIKQGMQKISDATGVDLESV